MATSKIKQKPQKTPRQLSLKIKTWGGKRKGAGRPNKSGAVNHMQRPSFSSTQPLHITLRLRKGLGGLRNKGVHVLLQTAVKEMAKFGTHVNHYSLQGNHLHLIIETVSQAALASAMKSFGSRFAKGIKKLQHLKTTQIFNGRYHVTILKNPTQTRNALRYVLLNQAQHSQLLEHIDIYSSGFYFSQWRKLIGRKFSDLIEKQAQSAGGTLPNYLQPPRTWLLREGWTRA
jgi:putative transposase